MRWWSGPSQPQGYIRAKSKAAEEEEKGVKEVEEGVEEKVEEVQKEEAAVEEELEAAQEEGGEEEGKEEGRGERVVEEQLKKSWCSPSADSGDDGGNGWLDAVTTLLQTLPVKEDVQNEQTSKKTAWNQVSLTTSKSVI